MALIPLFSLHLRIRWLVPHLRSCNERMNGCYTVAIARLHCRRWMSWMEAIAAFQMTPEGCLVPIEAERRSWKMRGALLGFMPDRHTYI